MVESGRGCSSLSTRSVADVDGDDLVGEPARGQRLRVALLRAQRPLVLLLAADAELGGDLAAVHAHEHAVGRAAQPVAVHAVDGGAVAEARAEALVLEQVRRARHALHAAGDDDVRLARADQQRARG